MLKIIAFIIKYQEKAKFYCLTLLLFVISSKTSFGQQNDIPINLPKYDHQPIHFGFLLGINSADFRVKLASDLKTRDSIFVVESNSVSGLNLGILANLRIAENFDLRFLPDIAFSQRNLLYTFYNTNGTANGTAIKKIESTYLNFPLDLKFKSDRVNNYRIYVLAGWRFSIDMVSQAKVRQQDNDIVKLKRNDSGYEIGIGADFYLTYFKFSPEIKMFNGVNNLLVQENTVYSSPLNGLYSKIFLISFIFE